MKIFKSLSNSPLTTFKLQVRTADMNETEQKIYGVETKISWLSTECFIEIGALPLTVEIFFSNNLVKLEVNCLPFMQYILTYLSTHQSYLYIQIKYNQLLWLLITVTGLFDLTCGSDKAAFQSPSMELGQSPEGCSSFMFPRIMGPAKVHWLASNFCWNLFITWVKEHISSYCHNLWNYNTNS